MKTMSSFAPAATMFYTDLDKLDGLRTPVDYGSGVEYADGIADSLFPDADVGVQVCFWTICDNMYTYMHGMFVSFCWQCI